MVNSDEIKISFTTAEFYAIASFISLPKELQTFFYPLLNSSVQLVVDLTNLLGASTAPLLYDQVALHFSLSADVVKIFLLNLCKSGFPIELSDTTVRMRSRSEFQSKKKKGFG
jgi:hypothetical protein